MPLCLDYLFPIACALPCCIFVNIWSAFLRNDGAPSPAALAVIAGGCLNVIGDYLLIFRMNMGIRGACAATRPPLR